MANIHIQTMNCSDGLPRADNGAIGRIPLSLIAAKTLLQADSGGVYNNTGAAGSVTITLPSAPKDGTIFHVFITAAQTIVLQAAGGAKINAGSANGTLTAAGSQINVGRATVTAMGGNWFVSTAGTWT